MKFTVFNGSPAKEQSATQVIANAFLAGAAKAGAETQTIHLLDQNIGHCRGCFHCWFKTPGQCILKDDMASLMQQYWQSDVVCFATPVYTWNMTAALKNFVDRLAPLKSPLLLEQGGNFDLADTAPKTQKFVVLSNCGFPGEDSFQVMKVVFACCNPALEIYRNCGKLLKSTDPAVQATVQEYLSAVQRAGYELAAQGTVPTETAARLNMPLMAVQDYVRYIGM